MSSTNDQSQSPADPNVVESAHTAVNVIDTREAYLTAVDAIASGTGPVALDAERASGFRYSQRAYLIQVFRRGAGTFLLDPPAIGRLDELNKAIAAEEWVFHAASQDLACLREVGLDPTKIFDTELGARLLGLPRVGLGTVVEELLGVHLAKEHSAADWSTRPLPQSWLVYAALDVELLVDLRYAEDQLLHQAGKSEIARQEFAAEVAQSARHPKVEGWRRLSGVHSIRGAQHLAVARELWETRDRYAQEIDTAPGRLVPDSSLVAAAKALPGSKRELAALREFSGRASRSELERWWTAIETGKAAEDVPILRMPGDVIPPPRAWSERNPEADKRLRLARTAMSELASQQNLPVENLLTPEFLRRVAWTPPNPLSGSGLRSALGDLGARPWQLDAAVPTILEAFVEADQASTGADEAAS